jgi:hypothetical protein
MEDHEIYDLAASVVGTLASELTSGIYAETKGTLTSAWKTEPRFNASAQSNSDSSKPPDHTIVLHYELARQLYRDAEQFVAFVTDQFDRGAMRDLLRDLDVSTVVSEFVQGGDDSSRNMFLSTLTWVFFHEFGHLSQEHGWIRSSGAGAHSPHIVEECKAAGDTPLVGREAAIAHVTELAADFEATTFCLRELIRHFLPQPGSGRKASRPQFRRTLFGLVSGIACACYRFHGMKGGPREHLPLGTHPHPLRRLEVAVSQIYELLDLIEASTEEGHGMTRTQLVQLGTAASFCAAVLWSGSIGAALSDEDFIKGLLNDHAASSYWGAIITMWDEIEPQILAVRRFDSGFGLLRFTDEFRVGIAARAS